MEETGHDTSSLGVSEIETGLEPASYGVDDHRGDDGTRPDPPSPGPADLLAAPTTERALMTPSAANVVVPGSIAFRRETCELRGPRRRLRRWSRSVPKKRLKRKRRYGRTMNRLAAGVAVALALLAFASPAAAHLLNVNSPGGGNAVHDHWVGGPGAAPSLPADGQGLFPGFFGPLPAAHGKGLVNACETLKETPAAASILAPGVTGTGCHHGD